MADFDTKAVSKTDRTLILAPVHLQVRLRFLAVPFFLDVSDSGVCVCVLCCALCIRHSEGGVQRPLGGYVHVSKF